MDPKEVVKAKVSALSAQILENLRLSQSLPDPETPSECILNEIAVRQSILAEVESQICDLKTRQNELLPIHRLPVEILAMILSTALPLPGYHKGRTKLLLVCRTWRDVINTNPSTFWTILSTTDSPSQYDRLLKMSRQMPVTIYMDRRSRKIPTSRKLVEDVTSKRLAFREVVFIGSSDPHVEHMLESFLFAPAPHLQSLDLVVNGGCTIGNGDTNSQQAETNSIATPNLTSIRLVGVSIPWNAAILRGLRSLSLEYLGRSNAEAKAPTLRELVKVLQGCPGLRYLTLRSIAFCLDDRREASTGISLNELISIDLSDRSLRPTCDLLQCIQYPETATLSVRIEHLEDNWQVDLGVIISQLPRNWITAPIRLKVEGLRMTLSAKNFQVYIPCPKEERENTGSLSAYKELFSSLGAPILAAITSLRLDTFASQNSTAILTAANEFFPNLTKLSISPYQRLKSKKPWHVVLEKVVQSTEDTNRPVCLCPNLTSLEIDATYYDRPDLPSILQLVRTRILDRKFKGKRVKKSPITFIFMNINSGRLSSEQLGLLNELKGEVTEVCCRK